MKIGISAELIGTMAGGMETYDYNLTMALAGIDTDNQYHIYTVQKNALQELDNNHTNFSVRYLGTSSRTIAIPFALPWELWHRKVDIFHATFVPPPFCPTKYIFTVHDLACITHPEWFPPLVRYRLSKFISLGIRKAVKIIAVSEATKRDIINTFGLEENQIEVIHEGVNRFFHPIQDQGRVRQVLQKHGIDGEYILYVGRFHVRKNLIRLLQAYDLMRKECASVPKLVLVGREHYYSSQVFRVIEELNLDKQVISPGHVDDGDLPLLYNGAKAFIYPSLFEGFGLPPLEAMACGTPVLTSNCSSLPEVVGDAAILVDPFDVQELAVRMHQLISDDGLRMQMIESGLSRAQKFTWEETARKTLKLYEDVYFQIGKDKNS